MVEQWWHDIRIAARGLRRAPAFSAAAVLTLAVGIAGTTVMWALVQGVLLRPLPVRDQEQLIVAWKEVRATGFAHMPYMRAEFDGLRGATDVLESVAAVDYNGAWRMVVEQDGTASYMMASPVSGEFFDVLGVAPLIGRALQPADDIAGAAPVVVIGHGLWQRKYGGGPGVLGRTIKLREKSFTIVGVMPRDFEFPRQAEAWLTIATVNYQLLNANFQPELDLIARLRPGGTVAQAVAELDAFIPRLRTQAFEADGQTAVVRRYEDVIVGDVRAAMLILFGAVALVLLIASANVANLLLIRGASRRPELAVRSALGAGRGRLAHQVLAESAVIAFCASAIGFAITWWSLQTLVRVVPYGLPRVESIAIDGGVLAFTVLVAFLATALAGAAPAVSIMRADLSSYIRAGGRGMVGSATRHGRRVLVIAQVALAVVVIAVAGLLTRSLLRLQSMDVGLTKDQLVFVELSLPFAMYSNPPRHFRFVEDLKEQLEGTAEISLATPVNVMPFSGTGGWDMPQFTAEGQPAERALLNPALNMEVVHPDHFATLGIPLTRGRTFAEADGPDAPPVTIVSEDVARRTWPGEDPIGKRLKGGGIDSQDRWRTVVGVAAQVRYRELADARATIYFPARQFNFPGGLMVLRTSADPARVATIIQERVRSIDSNVQVMDVKPFAALLAAPLARPRFSALLIGVFGITALLLAAVGLYGVMSAYVRQRNAEIGIRVALGASAADVRRLVLGEGMKLATIGALIGLSVALVCARLVQGLLYEVSPVDPTSMLAAGSLLLGIAALACYLPARKATRVDPMSVLRTD